MPVAPVRFAVGILEDAAGLFGGRLPIGRANIDTKLKFRKKIEPRRREEREVFLGFSGSGPRLNTLHSSLRELNGAGKTDQEKANPAQIGSKMRRKPICDQQLKSPFSRFNICNDFRWFPN